MGSNADESRDRAPSDLGERESGTVRLEQAVAADPASRWRRGHANGRPRLGPNAKHIPGPVSRMLGKRESGTAQLEQAVAAYRAALGRDSTAASGHRSTGLRLR